MFGLDHQNPDSAHDHLVRVLNDLRNWHTFPPVNVQRGDAMSALDYAFISLSSSVPGPRPDLLEDLHLLLNTVPDLQNGLPTEWFLYGVSIGKPTLLFSFNTQGAPPNPVSHPMPLSTSENIVQPQLDCFRSEFGHFTSTLNTMFDRISQAEQRLEQNNQTLLGMMSAQYLLGNYHMNLHLLTNEQDRLNAQCDHYHDQLTTTPNPSSHQHLQDALTSANIRHSVITAEIEQVCMETQALHLSLATHNHLTLPTSLPPTISPPAVSPSVVPSPSTPLPHSSHTRSCSPDNSMESCGTLRPHLQSVADSRWAPPDSESVNQKGKKRTSDDMIEV
ncbi:hypothetical protein EDC04DRAFT_2901513 [Pisolithus marmoratus]|nr:hypothetical protein EDC04DRAFT_2901513 [Pisolithus marmoratus]